MQRHVGHAQDINLRLNNAYAALVGLVGRLYGEGVTGSADNHAAPKAAGACHEMSSILSDIDETASRLMSVAERLQSLA